MRKNERETVRVEDLACSNMLMLEALVEPLNEEAWATRKKTH